VGGVVPDEAGDSVVTLTGGTSNEEGCTARPAIEPRADTSSPSGEPPRDAGRPGGTGAER